MGENLAPADTSVILLHLFSGGLGAWNALAIAVAAL